MTYDPTKPPHLWDNPKTLEEHLAQPTPSESREDWSDEDHLLWICGEHTRHGVQDFGGAEKDALLRVIAELRRLRAAQPMGQPSVACGHSRTTFLNAGLVWCRLCGAFKYTDAEEWRTPKLREQPSTFECSAPGCTTRDGIELRALCAAHARGIDQPTEQPKVVDSECIESENYTEQRSSDAPLYEGEMPIRRIIERWFHVGQPAVEAAHEIARLVAPEPRPANVQARASSGLAPFHETVEYALRGIETWDEDGGCSICLTRDGHGQVWNDELEKNTACPVEDLRRALAEPRMADVLPLDARVEMEQLRQRIEAAKGMIQQMDTVVVRQRQQIHDLTELLSEASGWLQDPSAYHGTDGAADFDKRLGEALTPQGKDGP